MLARRGFRPALNAPDVPFRPNFPSEAADRLAQQLEHYAFRLFLRGAIEHRGCFAPREATRYLDAAQARRMAEALVDLGLAARSPGGRYELLRRARSFGGTLEWWVARELRHRLGFDTLAGVKFPARGIGGDLDVVAAAEGKLVYIELKSSPPKHLGPGELSAFLGRLRALRPDVALFAMDTALRLSDKVIPMLLEALTRPGSAAPRPRRIERELWALTSSVFAVNAKPDLLANIGRAIAEGFRALSPEPP